MTTKFVHFSPFKKDEDVASVEEDIEGLKYMEQLNKHISRLQYVENIS